MTYVELQVTTHFSFLRGASSPDELFAAGALLGHSALGVAGLTEGNIFQGELALEQLFFLRPVPG